MVSNNKPVVAIEPDPDDYERVARMVGPLPEYPTAAQRQERYRLAQAAKFVRLNPDVAASLERYSKLLKKLRA